MHEVYKVPLPRKAGTQRSDRWKHPYPTMKIGEAFFLPLGPNQRRASVTTHTSTIGKKLGRCFQTRSCPVKPNGKPGGWMQAVDGEKGAVPGVGVWRTA